jgi:hypothetical protein
MTQNNIPSELYNSICEAVGCFAIAESEVRIPVGNLGLLKLLVCNNCIPKFTDREFVLKKKSDANNDESIKPITS